jgi:hypothetical protein
LPFLLLHLIWIFPWSAFLPAAFKPGNFENQARASQLRLLAFLWITFLLAFLSLSTTQEYYSMPCYPAFAVLIGAALAGGSKRWVSFGYELLLILGSIMAAVTGVILYLTRDVAAVGDISSALTHNPDAYTLSLGHLHDLTLQSFAYLRGPLFMAGVALGVGSALACRTRGRWIATLFLATMMTVLVHAANWAMAVFDPYLSSRPLAEAIAAGPEGQLIIEGHYYPASSVAFYSNQPALLLNGRVDNMVYGAAAPGAPPVFIEDTDLAGLWQGSRRIYLVAPVESRARLEALLGTVYVFAERGGKCVLSNLPK